MERDYYKSPKPSFLMRFFWKAAGGDRYLLEKSTYSDQVKYMCLGGIIFATGLMAGLAGGYAFYTIFEPRGSSLDQSIDLQTVFLSAIFGLFWGLMIFNLDRFIVSSTGKGDGTEAITKEEFRGAIPRLILGAIIAITISKPVEIRMFKTEIDAALRGAQNEMRGEFEKSTNAIFEERIALIEADLAKIEKGREDLVERLKKAEEEHTNQLQGRAGAGAGNGPLSKALEKIKLDIKQELDEFDEKNSEELNNLAIDRRNLLKEKREELSNNEEVAAGLDGLLERIKLAHKIAGFWISLFITLLFLAIELTPIFFKLMLIKSPYDFLKDNVEELIKVENGIYVQYNYHKDKQGQERDLVTYLNKEKLLNEKKELVKAQEELTNHAIEQYKKEMKRKIERDPGSFVKVDNDLNN